MSIDPTAFIHETAVIDDGAVIGPNVKIWHFCHVMSGAVIGEGTSIGQCCYVASDVTIGKNCKIQNSVNIYDGVVLEDSVFIGPSVTFTNVKFPRAYRKGKYEKTVIKQGAAIGAGAVLICGITVGEQAMVAASACVTKDVPSATTVMGVPAQIKRDRRK